MDRNQIRVEFLKRKSFIKMMLVWLKVELIEIEETEVEFLIWEKLNVFNPITYLCLIVSVIITAVHYQVEMFKDIITSVPTFFTKSNSTSVYK